ncbi:glucosaminidase domain-containing protein [Geobacillus thermodenitrificans]|uniref:glucosaminidase domain-containing protein n=1 Tax=Geobacillus thermodenitrificans TaxID=33940 RepID=UPI001F1C8156|nr:glucosaminidase domain-containing protein [Geobacillus thermodenitrificans]
MNAAEKYGIDPVLLIAIALHETGYGTSHAVKNKNNPGGIMDPSTGKLKVFDSLEDASILWQETSIECIYLKD